MHVFIFSRKQKSLLCHCYYVVSVSLEQIFNFWNGEDDKFYYFSKKNKKVKYFHKITFQKEIKDFEKPSSSDQNKEKLKKLPFSERFYVSNKLMQQNTEEKKLKTTKAAKVKSRLQKETVKKVFKEFF